MLDEGDIGQEVVLVEGFAGQLHLHAVGVRVADVLRAPISPDQVMLGDQLAANSNGVHPGNCTTFISI